MSSHLEYAPLQSSDLDRMPHLFRHAFASTADGVRHYMSIIGPDNFRVMRRAGVAVGTVALLDMGQYFGGRSVPCRGIAAVTIDPAERGRGTATRMMTAMLEEARADGLPISTLYAATQPLYAKVGYANAGTRMVYRVPLAMLRGQRPDPIPQLASATDSPLIAALQSEQARRTNGLLERGPLMWQRARGTSDRPFDTYLIPGDKGPEGYLTLGPKSPDRSLHVEDWAALTPRAAHAILAFLAGWHSQVNTVSWTGSPEDLLLHHLPEVGVTIASWEQWMLRVTDVAGALLARGWPLGVRTALTLNVTDPLLPDNAGSYRLEIEDGRANVERLAATVAADLELGVDALATLYTGHVTPRVLADLGRIKATPQALATATTLFAGPRPWLADMF
jgi:predicted acetyltransferase